MKIIQILSSVLLLLFGSCLRESIYPQLPYEENNETEDSGQTVEEYNREKIAPAHISDYVLVEDLSDEFNGDVLDKNKWSCEFGPGNWTGRGAKFLPENVCVNNGLLQLKSSIFGTDEDLKELYMQLEDMYVPDKSQHKGEDIDVNTWKASDYGNYWKSNWEYEEEYDEVMKKGLNTIGAATVMSKQRGGLGYYEARIKPSKISLSSSFWLKGNNTIEYDITECIGELSVTTDNETINKIPYRIPTSVWIDADDYENKGGIKPHHYFMDRKVSDVFFVIGLLWESNKLTLYINDKEIYQQSLENVRTEIGNLLIPMALFSEPQNIVFDTEVLLGPDTGWPSKKDLLDENKNIFYIDWVRVWKPKE